MEESPKESTVAEEEDVVESLTTDPEEAAPKKRGRPAKAASAGSGDTILLHIVEDGFTASGAVWMRGQELEFKKDTPEYRDTLDRTGKSWLDLLGDDAAQMEMFGKVMFRPGPWPGAGFEVPEAQKAEEQRGRKPPRLGDKI